MSKYADLKGKRIIIKPAWRELPTMGTIIEVEDHGIWLAMELGVSHFEFSVDVHVAVKKRIAELENGVYFIPLSNIHYILTDHAPASGRKAATLDETS